MISDKQIAHQMLKSLTNDLTIAEDGQPSR